MAGEEAGKLEQSGNWFIHFKFLFAREYFYIHIYHSYICLNGWRQSKALSGYWFFQLPVVFNSSEFQCSFFTTPKCTFETPAVHIKSWLTCVSSIWSLAWSHATRSDPEKKLIFVPNNQTGEFLQNHSYAFWPLLPVYQKMSCSLNVLELSRMVLFLYCY